MHPIIGYQEKDAHRIIGLMSGTSADGIDAVLLEVRGHGQGVKVRSVGRNRGFLCVPMPEDVRAAVLRIAGGAPVRAEEICRLTFVLGELYADACVALCESAGVDPEDIRDGLATYEGVRRRFEYIGTVNGADYYDDYAHHPDEIKATLSAAKGISRGRVICAFQPHNYSRLRDLFNSFTASFADADELILTKLYAPREAAQEDYTSERLASLAGATYIDRMEDITPYLLQTAQEGDVVLYMGAGNIEKEAEKIRKMKK